MLSRTRLIDVNTQQFRYVVNYVYTVSALVDGSQVQAMVNALRSGKLRKFIVSCCTNHNI